MAAVFAAAYAAAVVSLAPISFHVFQVRIADALLPLSILFGWPAVAGLTFGCAVANLFGGLGPIDVVGGSAANFLATALAWKIGGLRFKGSWLLAVTAENLTVTLIVGSYLSYIFNVPLGVSLAGVLLGSTMAINVVGYLLLKAVSRTKALGPA